MKRLILFIFILSINAFSANKDCVDGALSSLLTKDRRAEYGRQKRRERELERTVTNLTSELENSKIQLSNFIESHSEFELLQSIEKLKTRMKLKEIQINLADGPARIAKERELKDLEVELDSIEREWNTFQTFGDYDANIMRDFRNLESDVQRLGSDLEEASRQLTEQRRMLTE